MVVAFSGHQQSAATPTCTCILYVNTQQHTAGQHPEQCAIHFKAYAQKQLTNAPHTCKAAPHNLQHTQDNNSSGKTLHTTAAELVALQPHQQLHCSVSMTAAVHVTRCSSHLAPHTSKAPPHPPHNPHQTQTDSSSSRVQLRTHQQRRSWYHATSAAALLRKYNTSAVRLIQHTIRTSHLDGAFAHLPLLRLLLHALLKLCKGLGACSTRTSLGGGSEGAGRGVVHRQAVEKGGGCQHAHEPGRIRAHAAGDMPEGTGRQTGRQTDSQTGRQEMTVRQTGEGVPGGKGRLTTDIALRSTYDS